ncbi:Protein kinase domain-containing protein [Trichostrongylus colubriformis]|uniref:Protein kinase domain-containing protein n=1 Tax=Trichostrongylus colubriformis TaxID=6319 RepID=A0AAN8GCS9_TRICO
MQKDRPTLSPTNLPKGKIIAHRWRIKQKLGEGGFGAVYKVVDVQTMTPAAMKVETTRKHGVLKLEAMILRRLEDYPFVPHLLGSGKKPTYSYIILTLLGPSLNKILKFYGRICSVSTQVRIGINTLYAIKQLHDIGFIHRDLKPGNLAVGPVGTPRFRLIHMFATSS